MNRHQLKILGLSVNETKVVKSLSHVPMSLAEVEKKTSLPHASVVDTLGRLVKREIVKVVHSQRRKTYTCEIGRSFSTGIESNKEPADGVEVYEGKEALLSLISSELVRHRHGRLLSFHGEEVGKGWLGILDPKEIQKRNELIVEHDIIVERFVSRSGYRKLFKQLPIAWQKTMLGRTHVTYFLPDEYFQTKTELMMFSDVVMVYETHKPQIILFRDKETIKLYSSIFEIMRTIGVKINSEEEFRSYLDY